MGSIQKSLLHLSCSDRGDVIVHHLNPLKYCLEEDCVPLKNCSKPPEEIIVVNDSTNNVWELIHLDTVLLIPA